ncbi:hypothetical protein CANCADRAFT_32457 [Tortispora caseinolytica NRRL Y-17796]|uniref:Carbohydrate kinase PfkB domain-containing protein n=1 Tax=Tortispora caseinolytica NRRL Y-17796 TaxID=767744 RepID=A0A1E4TBG3_9ASCO|nr:hypothetical protein CANCADRAFT_32457 [Tortispora caseinolytica NRRL Y-17796]
MLTTLGMFIVDEIHYNNGEVLDNIIGGAGTFTIIGGRIIGGPNSTTWIVDCGSDFDPHIRSQLDDLELNTIYRVDQTRLTTKGLNVYGPGEHRSFEYLTPKKRLTSRDLIGTGIIQSVTGIHLICGAQRLKDNVLDLERNGNFLYFWEPVPDLFIESERDRTLKILNELPITVVSPNMNELGQFYGKKVSEDQPDWRDVAIELVNQLYSDTNVPVVIRCGRNGAILREEHSMCHVPAYHYSSSEKVIDPTGAGNAFMGGLAAAYIQTRDLRYSVCCGSVAASYVVEQIGIPTYRNGLWNDTYPVDRIKDMTEACTINNL